MVPSRPGSWMTAVLTAAVLLTSCSAGEPDPAPSTGTTPAEPGSTTPDPVTTAPTTGPEADSTSGPTSALEPFDEYAGPVSAPASTGAQLALVDLTSAEHEQFDRVVLTFDGSGTPGWQVDYAANPSADGSGRPITLDGDGALSAHVSGVALPTEADPQLEPQTTETDLPEIAEIHLEGWFEGQVQLVLGLDSAHAPFRVFALSDPTRVVIDVQHVED